MFNHLTRRCACRRVKFQRKTRNPEKILRVFIEKLAATYSRRTYRTTTIGKTVFDGRVRNGIGSDHSFRATKMKRETLCVISKHANQSTNVKEQPKPITFYVLRITLGFL